MKKYFIPIILILSNVVFGQNWTKQYDYVDNCICGLSKVSKDGAIGFVDQKGNLVVPLIYQEALTFNEGYTAMKKDNKWGFLDSTGKVIINPQYEEADSFYEGLAAVRKNGKFGFIDNNNKTRIPFVYHLVSGFSEGLAAVQNDKDIWGYIGIDGKISLSFKYSYAGRFDFGKARIMKGGKILYIDKQGNLVEE